MKNLINIILKLNPIEVNHLDMNFMGIVVLKEDILKKSKVLIGMRSLVHKIKVMILNVLKNYFH